MIPRYPIPPELAKAIIEEQKERRRLNEERKRLREEDPELYEQLYPTWRYPFGWRTHAIATLILLAVLVTLLLIFA